MGEVLRQGAVPPPPPGFVPVDQAQSASSIPPPPPGFVPVDQPAPAQAAPSKPWYQMTMHELAQAGAGFMKSAQQTMSAMPVLAIGSKMMGEGGMSQDQANLVGVDPNDPNFTASVSPQQQYEKYRQELAPVGASQKIGAGLEQAGEMMLTGGPLRKGATVLAGKAASRMAAPAARIAAEALNVGANASVHGESPAAGAVAGAAGGAIGEGLSALAPSIAESALGIRARDRMRGKTPGQAILTETRGVTPATVADSAQTAASEYNRQLESAAAAASNVPASTNPAVQVIDDAIAKATKQNSATMVQKLTTVRDQLTKDITNGQPLPNPTTPEQVLNLKRGIGDLVNTWNPQEAKGIQPTIKQVYGALDGELDRTVPDADQLNQKISSLIPVAKRAQAVDDNADLTQRMIHRAIVHTGAGASAIAGGFAGYHAKREDGTEGGIPGAVVGTGLGLLLPEMAASPTTQLTAARLMAAHTGKNVLIRIGEGLVLQMTPSGKASVENLEGGQQKDQK